MLHNNATELICFGPDIYIFSFTSIVLSFLDRFKRTENLLDALNKKCNIYITSTLYVPSVFFFFIEIFEFNVIPSWVNAMTFTVLNFTLHKAMWHWLPLSWKYNWVNACESRPPAGKERIYCHTIFMRIYRPHRYARLIATYVYCPVEQKRIISHERSIDLYHTDITFDGVVRA